MGDPVEIVSDYISGGLRHATAEATAALRSLLADGWRIVRPAEHDDHFVTFDADGWQIGHSAECRNAGRMLSCAVHRELSAWCPGAPVGGEGRYRVVFDDPEPTPSFYERPPTPRLDHTFGLYLVQPGEPAPEALLFIEEWTPEEGSHE